jgi:diguanylate cyclase
VLKAIADSLTEACGQHMVARYGGEEFAVLFTGMALERAKATLETARASVATKRYRVRESDTPLGEITFSAGLTAAIAGEPLEPAFQRADRLLYDAKSGGRNRVCLA